MATIRRITPINLYLLANEIEQREIADATAIPRHRIQRICSGRAKVRPDERKLICETLRQPESVLFGPDPVPITGDVTQEQLRRLMRELLDDEDFAWLLWRLALKVQARISD